MVVGTISDITKNLPHNQAKANCINCDYDWIAVVKVGVTEFECPKCKKMKGFFIETVIPHTEEIWMCDCGCQLFYIGNISIYCSECGVEQSFP